MNFSKITPAFKEAFHIFNFETMFEENITEYINNITEKIKDIQTFGNIIELIDEKRMKEDNQKDYIRILKEKYKSVIKDNIKSIKNDKLNNGIKTIAKFVSKIFLFDKIIKKYTKSRKNLYTTYIYKMIKFQKKKEETML